MSKKTSKKHWKRGMSETVLYTIGFTKKSAEEFFTALKTACVRRLIDVRLNNVSQLAGFAKRDDLAFFLEHICACAYEHRVAFAPTKAILDDYRKKVIDWAEYERRFKAILDERQIEHGLDADQLDHACLLCSEPSASKCHRRLVAEYLKDRIGGIRIVHL
jgi:uncharacterized protein (DUF488 family)